MAKKDKQLKNKKVKEVEVSSSSESEEEVVKTSQVESESSSEGSSSDSEHEQETAKAKADSSDSDSSSDSEDDKEPSESLKRKTPDSEFIAVPAEESIAEVEPKKFKHDESQAELGEFVVSCRGLSFNASEDQIRTYFDQCGHISGIEFEYFEDSGKFRGSCKVAFSRLGGQEAAIALDGSELDGRTLSIFADKQKSNDKNVAASKGVLGETKALFVGNIPFQADENIVREVFAEFGEITRLSLPVLEDGRPKGFGIVVFDSSEAVNTAMSRNGELEIFGRVLRLDPSIEKDRDAPRGGGFRGGRGGRGGGNFRGGGGGNFRGGGGFRGGRGGPRGGGGRGRGGGNFRGGGDFRGGRGGRGGFRVDSSAPFNKKISFN